jgi:hypothetical protein
LEFKVNGSRILRMEQTRGYGPNIIAGTEQNYIAGHVGGATIAGGGAVEWAGQPLPNAVTGMFGTVGGGAGNIASGEWWATVTGGFQNNSRGVGATVGGGMNNSANGQHGSVGGGVDNRSSGYSTTVAGGRGNDSIGDYTFVGGGLWNRANGALSAIGGGQEHHALGVFGTIGGGYSNTSSNLWSTVPGGRGNVAGGRGSFAAGTQAHAIHDGSFVWADDPNLPLFIGQFTSAGPNEFSVRATGGARFVSAVDSMTGTALSGVTLAPGSGSWSSLSDRRAKENFATADAREILDKVAALPLASWNYKAQGEGVRHLGPTAQDFHAAFGLGESERTIATVDADGVALAAIQGLNQKLEETRAEVKRRDAENAELKARLAALERIVLNLSAKGN